MLGVFNPFTGVNSGILCVANKIVNVQNSGIETLVSERYRHRQQLPVMCSYIKRIISLAKVEFQSSIWLKRQRAKCTFLCFYRTGKVKVSWSKRLGKPWAGHSSSRGGRGGKGDLGSRTSRCEWLSSQDSNVHFWNLHSRLRCPNFSFGEILTTTEGGEITKAGGGVGRLEGRKGLGLFAFDKCSMVSSLKASRTTFQLCFPAPDPSRNSPQEAPAAASAQTA